MIRRPPRSTLFPLHDALPISGDLAALLHGPDRRDWLHAARPRRRAPRGLPGVIVRGRPIQVAGSGGQRSRSEEHTSELQSRQYLVCRLLLEKKKKQNTTPTMF